MKNLILGAVVALSFSAIAHADPIIECPPDYQGGRMRPAITVAMDVEGDLTAVAQDEQSETIVSEEQEGFQAILKLIADRDCRYY